MLAALSVGCGPYVGSTDGSDDADDETNDEEDPTRGGRGSTTSGGTPSTASWSASDADVTTNTIPTDDDGSTGWASSSTTDAPGPTTGPGGVPTTGPTSDSQGPGPGSDTGSCDFVPGDPACGACLAEQCCDAVTVCLDDPDCGCILGCFDAFTPTGLLACLRECSVATVPPALNPVADCATEACAVCL